MKTSRESLLINKTFQLRFIAYSLLLVALVAAIVSASNLFFFQTLLDEAVRVGVGSTDPFYIYLQDTKNKLLMASIVSSVIVGMVILILSLVLSHRIAGPIHHTVLFLKRRSKGEKLEKLSFREKDFFPELADSVNGLLKRVDQDEK